MLDVLGEANPPYDGVTFELDHAQLVLVHERMPINQREKGRDLPVVLAVADEFFGEDAPQVLGRLTLSINEITQRLCDRQKHAQERPERGRLGFVCAAVGNEEVNHMPTSPMSRPCTLRNAS